MNRLLHTDIRGGGTSLPAEDRLCSARLTANRWWIYQRERFPVAAHTPVIAALSVSAVSYSALLRGGVPAWRTTAVAFACSFLFFLELRVADEFKDFDDDSRYRPYRPVPRGLVKLSELGWLGAGCVAAQFGLALWLSPRLLISLAITGAYLSLMCKEFFVGSWLKRHAAVYMISHSVITPLILLFATACDWIPQSEERMPRRLLWFLITAYLSSVVFEIGRKIRAPGDEERGVETYSFLWGRRNAVLAWLLAIAAGGGCAYAAARTIHFEHVVGTVNVTLFLVASAVGMDFLRSCKPRQGKWIETISGLWALLVYLSLGAMPILLQTYGGPK